MLHQPDGSNLGATSSCVICALVNILHVQVFTGGQGYAYSSICHVLITYLVIKNVAIYQHTSFCLITKFYVIMSLCKRCPTTKTAVFGQDICNRHGYKCTHTNKGILFFKLIITLLEHNFGKRNIERYLDI